MPGPLAGTVALVTGASRGIGKGVALGLGEAGATVYVTGRTIPQVEATARGVTREGGKGIAAPSDHRDDGQVRAVFRRIEAEQGRLDVLVSNLSPNESLDRLPFWELPLVAWDEHAAVLRGQYAVAYFAAPLMISQGEGLIVFISSSGSVNYFFNAPYHAVKAAVDKLAADMAHELEPHGVSVVSLWPGLSRTERVLARAGEYESSRTATPQFTGRAVAALASNSRHILEDRPRVASDRACAGLRLHRYRRFVAGLVALRQQQAVDAAARDCQADQSHDQEITGVRELVRADGTEHQRTR
jgi:dehydrogenase/reductase SDR family member 1